MAIVETPLSLHQLGWAMSNPEAVLSGVAVARAERRLRDYVKLAWKAIEPSTPLVLGKPLDAICEHLEGVTMGHIKRLIINVPPGCMKSLTTCVFWPSWEWGPRRLPSTRYICTSYNQNLMIRDNLRCRNLITSPEYQAAWGDVYQLTGDQNTKVKFENDQTGWKQAASTGSVMGERGNRFIIDDPHSVQGAESEAELESALFWFAEAVPTRLNSINDDAIVIIMQRLHERDVAGFAIAKELGYEVLCMPMEYEPDHPHRWGGDWRTVPGELLWPDRFNEEAVAKLKKQLRSWGGTYAEAGQLQQRPTARGGGMFKKAWFNVIPNNPGGRSVRAWDFAASTRKKSPYTVGVKLVKTLSGRYVVADVVREQLTPAGVEELLLATAKADGYGTIIDIPQDPGQAGKAQVHAFVQKLDGYVVHYSPETGSKEDRARPFAAQAEGGNVDIVAAPWNDAYTSEMGVFPRGEFMDQADATSRAHARHLAAPEQPIPGAPEELDMGGS